MTATAACKGVILLLFLSAEFWHTTGSHPISSTIYVGQYGDSDLRGTSITWSAGSKTSLTNWRPL